MGPETSCAQHGTHSDPVHYLYHKTDDDGRKCGDKAEKCYNGDKLWIYLSPSATADVQTLELTHVGSREGVVSMYLEDPSGEPEFLDVQEIEGPFVRKADLEELINRYKAIRIEYDGEEPDGWVLSIQPCTPDSGAHVP